jgi:tetratricopeptide (TPR) repeat protein
VRQWRILGLCLLLGALSAIVPLALALEVRAPQARGTAADAMVIPRAITLRPFLLGFHPLVADLYWIQTIQYFGEHLQTDRQYPSLYPLVNFVTGLDPHFVDAFRLGGLFLVIARQFPQAISVYEKGIAANPERWELPHDLGRLYFLELKEPERALQWWLVADRIPGRPHYLPRMIARLYAKTGALETALELWKVIYEESGNEWIKSRARKEIQSILAQMRTQHSAQDPGRKSP